MPILVDCQLEETKFKEAPGSGENNTASQAEAGGEGFGGYSIVSTVDQVVANNLNYDQVEVPHGEEMQQAKETQPVAAIFAEIVEVSISEEDRNRQNETGHVEEVEASNLEKQPSDNSSEVVVETECPSEIEVYRVMAKELGELGEDMGDGNNEEKQLWNENLAILAVSEGSSVKAEHEGQEVAQADDKVGESLSEDLYTLVDGQGPSPGELSKFTEGGTVVQDDEVEASHREHGLFCDGKPDTLLIDEELPEGKLVSEMEVWGQKEELLINAGGDETSDTQEIECFSQKEGEKKMEIHGREFKDEDSLSSGMREDRIKVDMEAEQNLEGGTNEIEILNEIDDQKRSGDVSNTEHGQKPSETVFSMIGGWPDGGNQEGFGGEEEGEEWTAGKVVGWTEMQAEDHVDTRHEEVRNVVSPIEGQFQTPMTSGSHGISLEYTSATQNSLFESSKLESSSLFQSGSSNSQAEVVSSPAPLAANQAYSDQEGSKEKNRLFYLKKKSNNGSTSVSKPLRRKAGSGHRPFFGSCFACVGLKKSSKRVPSEVKPTSTGSQSRVFFGSCASRTTAWCPPMGGTMGESQPQNQECLRTCGAEPGSDSDLETSRSLSHQGDKERREAHKNITCTYNDCLYPRKREGESGRENCEHTNIDGKSLETADRANSDEEVIMIEKRSSTSLGQDRSSCAGCIPLYSGGILEDFRFHREEKGCKERFPTVPVVPRDDQKSLEVGTNTQRRVKTPFNSSEKLEKEIC